MRVLVVNTNTCRNPMPVMPLGACIAAEAAERAGHEVRFADLAFARDPAAKLARAASVFQPGVVGMSIRNIDDNNMQRPALLCGSLPCLVEAARAACRCRVVIGGAAVGVMPEALLRFSGADAAVLGDGEAVFPALLRAIESGSPVEDVPGTAGIVDGAVRLNPLAFDSVSAEWLAPELPRWIRLRRYIAGMAAAPVQTRRGCPYRCVYCTYGSAEGRAYRLRPVEHAVDAVRRCRPWGARDVEFVDNVFNSPYDYALELCGALARARPGVRLHSLELNPRFVTDELLSAMERAGFAGIGITAESAADAVLEGLGKDYAAAEIAAAAEAVGRHRLPCVWVWMLGGPNETRQSVAETLRFARRHVRGSDAAFFNLGIRIYPGTGLEPIARAQGLLAAAPGEMLAPVFYFAPGLDPAWVAAEVQATTDSCRNFFGPRSLGLSLLPKLHRAAHFLGMRPPLWRHTRLLRRVLSCFGINHE